MTPDNALRRGATPSLEDLFALIHEVNPTDRKMSAVERERRYATKARLQSLLIRRFPEAIVAVPDGEDTVSLRQALTGRDFCHAVLSTLDEDIRLVLRRRLAEQPEPETAAPPPEPVLTADDPVTLGRAALESWDYDTARTLFEQANRESGGKPHTARTLVSLLVDVLVEDEAALAVALDSKAATDPTIRGRLAVAAARTGDADRAVRLLDGVAPKLAAEANRELAGIALHAGDWRRAEVLARAAGADTDLDLRALSAGIEAARHEEVRRLEPGLAGPSASHVARTILEILPTHPGAKGVVRTEGAERERARRDDAEAAAIRAEKLGDLTVWGRALDALESAGGDVTSARDRLKQRRSDLAIAAHIAEVDRAWTAGKRAEALTGWLGLDPSARSRTIVPVDLTAWLEGAVPSRPEVLASAAVAAHAAAAIEPRAARQLLAEHRDAGRALPKLRALLDKVDARCAALSADEVAIAERDVRAALAERDPVRAEAAFERLLRLGGSAALQSRVDDLVGTSLLFRSLEGGDPFVARDAARTLASIGEAVDVRRYEQAVEARYDVQRLALDIRDHSLEDTPRGGSWLYYANSDELALVVVTARERRLWIRAQQVDGGVPLWGLRLRLDRAFQLAGWRVLDDRVWVWDSRGAIVVVRFEPKVELVAVHDVALSLRSSEHLRGVIPTSDPARIWCEIRDEGMKRVTRLVDPTTGRAARDLVGVGGVAPVAWEGGQVLSQIRHGKHIDLVHAGPDGRSVHQVEIGIARAVAAIRGSTRLVVEIDRINPNSLKGLFGVGFAITGDGRPDARYYSDVNPLTDGVLAGEVGPGALMLASTEEGTLLVGIDEDGESWTAGLPSHSVLAHTSVGPEPAAAVLGATTADGVVWQELGHEPPPEPESPDELVLGTPGKLSCGGTPFPNVFAEEIQDLAHAFREVPDDQLLEHLRNLARTVQPVVVGFAGRVMSGDRDRLVRDLYRPFAEADPGNALLQLMAADEDVHDERWAEVRRRVSGIDMTRLEPFHRQHALHLLGLASYWLGEPKDAILRWTRALDERGLCKTELLLPLAEIALGLTSDGPVQYLHEQVRLAWDRLKAGDPEAAIEALDPPRVWMLREVRSAAVRAGAWLAVDAGAPDSAWRREIALCTYRQLRKVVAPRTHDAQWRDGPDDAWLYRLDTEVGAALDAMDLSTG